MGDGAIFSKEQRNFWILDVLIKHVAPPAMRKRFDVIVPPKYLANILNSNAKILQNLFSKKVINGYQQNILLRVPGVKLPTISALSTSGKKAASSEDFDLTLMICLLRNLNLVPEPVTGWDQLPPDSDNSLGANLTRIKVYRNKLSHPSKSRITDHLFKKIWTTLKTALSEISEGETDQMVHEVETFDFEGSNREQLLCKIQQGLHAIQNELQFHRNLKENTTNVLQEWKSELEIFYKTRGTSEVLDKIRTNNTVMIIGNSGAGKSTTMKYVSLQLEAEGYEIIPVSSANDIPFQRFSDRKQLFVIDDIFGKYHLDSMMFESWRRQDERLKVIFRDKNAKLLCTLRRQLQNDINQFSYENYFYANVIDLDSSDLALSEIEKKGMLENHLLHHNIETQFDDVSMQRMCSCNFAFPLQCKLFSSNPHFLEKKANFFTSPSKILKEELNHLQKANKEVYCALVLNIMFDCEELSNMFDTACKINRKDHYIMILEECEVSHSISRKILHKHLLSMAGIFVWSHNPFEFIHDNIEEAVACHFGSSFPQAMIRCCKRKFLRERIRIKRCAKDDENILIIEKSSFDALSKRVLNEIMDGKFRDVLLSEPLQNRVFIDHFISYLEKCKIPLKRLECINCTEVLFTSYLQAGKESRNVNNMNRLALIDILQDKKGQFIYWVAATGSCLLFRHMFERSKGIAIRLLEKYTFINELLHIAVLGESIDIIKLLIRKGAKVNSCDKYGIPLLCKIAGTNRCDIAQLLLEEGADKDQQDEVLGWTACHVASWFNEVEMLELLLSRGCDFDIVDFSLQVPLVVAVRRNNEQAVSALLGYGAFIPDKILTLDLPFTSSSMLQEALHNNNSKIVEMLLNSGRASNAIRVYFPLSFPKNSVLKEMAELFLKDLGISNSKSSLWNDFVKVCSAIHKGDTRMLHAIFNKSEVIRYSILRGTDVSRQRRRLLANFNQNYLLFSPLHFAALCDNFNAAIALLNYGAKPLKKDTYGRTALHIANSRAMLEVLLSKKTSKTVKDKESFQCKIRKVLINIFTFKFVPMIFTSFMNMDADLNISKSVNAKDSVGNTPIHSIVVRVRDFKKCLDAVETLIEHGANPCIRCDEGYLPIDHFRSVSPVLDEYEIKKGERLLECNKTKKYIKKEKWYYTSLTIIFITCYLWFLLFVAKRACDGCGSENHVHVGDSFSMVAGIFQFRYMYYLQFVALFILHHYILQLGLVIDMFAGRGDMPIRIGMHSEQTFFNFSEKIAIAMMTARIFLYGISSTTGHAIFNLYCVCLCCFLFVIHIILVPGRFFRKYQSLLLSVFKATLVCFMVCMVLALFFSPSTESKLYTCNLDHENWNFTNFFLFLTIKVFAFYLYMLLFIFRILRPLFCNLFQPIFWYRKLHSAIVHRCIVLFFIIEILILPVTMFICNIYRNM